jgi:hypothetical protein
MLRKRFTVIYFVLFGCFVVVFGLRGELRLELLKNSKQAQTKTIKEWFLAIGRQTSCCSKG